MRKWIYALLALAALIVFAVVVIEIIRIGFYLAVFLFLVGVAALGYLVVKYIL